MKELEFFQVMSLLLSDMPIAECVDGIFLHARSWNGDDDGIFELVSKLTKGKNSEPEVVINGSLGEGCVPGVLIWPGSLEYTKGLSAIDCKAILSKGGPHTLAEAISFSEVAEKMRWETAIVVAQPFQLLRIMCTHLHVMGLRNYPMRIFAMAPNSVNWNRPTQGSQAEPSVSRFDQIQGEFERLTKYREQGNLASIGELLDYLVVGRDLM